MSTVKIDRIKDNSYSDSFVEALAELKLQLL